MSDNFSASLKSDQKTEREAFVIRETQLAGQLQLSRDRIRALRRVYLREQQDWQYLDAGVYLTLHASAVIRAHRHEDHTQKTAPRQPQAQAAPKLLTFQTPFNGELIVWAAPASKPNLLIAYKPGFDPTNPLNLLTVRVRENQYFLRGDRIRATQGKTEKVFDLVGPCPQFRGEFSRRQKTVAK